MKLPWLGIGGVVAVLAAATAITAVAFAGTSTGVSTGFTISSGTALDRSSFSAQDRWFLDEIGETGAMAKIGERDGTTFYEGTREDGGKCFFTGSGFGGGGLSGGCLISAQLEQPLVDMSGVCVDPATGRGRLGKIEGIAADGIVSVAVVDEEGVLHKTPVVGNIYKMPAADIPNDLPCAGFKSRAIVALEGNGSQVFTEAIVIN
jgi:hypothetical protein